MWHRRDRMNRAQGVKRSGRLIDRGPRASPGGLRPSLINDPVGPVPQF